MWRVAVKYLIFLPIILIGLGQNTDVLFQLYNDRNMEALKTQLPDFTESSEKAFFEALFMNDADSCVEIYKAIYPDASSKLKPLVAKKLYEYYYARGFYITAQRYENRDVQSDYEIQLGAFISQNNAQALQKKLSAGGVTAYIVTKEIGQKTFYCVRMPGRENLQATESLADEIGKKFNLKYRIIK
jgi:hypothetical protein